MPHDDFYREAFEIDGDFAEYFPDESIQVEIGGRIFWVKDDEYAEERIQALEEKYAPHPTQSLYNSDYPKRLAENPSAYNELIETFNEVRQLAREFLFETPLISGMSISSGVSQKNAKYHRKNNLAFANADCPPIIEKGTEVKGFSEALCPPIY